MHEHYFVLSTFPVKSEQKMSFMFYRRNYYAGNWASFTFNGLLSWIEEYKVFISYFCRNVMFRKFWCFRLVFEVLNNSWYCFGLLTLGSTGTSKHKVRTGMEWSNWGWRGSYFSQLCRLLNLQSGSIFLCQVLFFFSLYFCHVLFLTPERFIYIK